LSGGAEPETSLPDEGVGGTVVNVNANAPVFSQGDPADAVFYVRKGLVRLTVVSVNGKEAVLATATKGQFFGESCVAGARARFKSATALTDCELLRVEKDVMRRALQRNRQWAELFVEKLLARNIRYEEDLADQLLNSSEKRLARALLLLSGAGHATASETVALKITQDALAEMVGTTRPRICSFMNRFRSLGHIDYDKSRLRVHRSLLNVVLR
jgi:CRP-like cAMP-binding protein